MFLWKALWLFGLFSRDKGDYFDVWVVKITSKQINPNVCLLLSKVNNIQKPCLSLKSGFFSYYWFANLLLPDKGDQEFIGTYPSLSDSKHHKTFLHNKILSVSRASNGWSTDKAYKASCFL